MVGNKLKKKKKSDGEAPRPRGRPKTIFKDAVERGRKAAKTLRNNLFGRRTPSPDPDEPGPESASGGVPLTGDMAREAQLAEEEYGVQPEYEDVGGIPVWLQHMHRERQKNWVLIDTVHTEDLPKWFNDQVRL